MLDLRAKIASQEEREGGAGGGAGGAGGGGTEELNGLLEAERAQVSSY
jgi:hypothetical protein